ncbi:MAG: Cu(I)/Ag(I) efflux system membrane fusion protein [Pseudoalteromonas distincta]|jgi:Cu(I)/Ag(I) efflux system membrane fusion protein
MISPNLKPRLAIGAAAIALLAGVGGYVVARWSAAPPPAVTGPVKDAKVLYWYDPMVPAQHFDKPGKSPFMDMQLLPKYAGESGGGGGVQIDPARTQNLGVRLATVEQGSLQSDLTATGVINYNERDVAIVQTKASGFVQRIYGRAPADVVRAGAPLADLLIPDWAGAQGEFLAMRRTGDAALIQAGRQRLMLLGMPPSLIASVEREGRVRNVMTVTTPTGGVIKTLAVRNGMTVAQGETLAEINGLSSVWLNAAVPEAQTGQVRLGEPVRASLTSYPGETFSGRVTAILPQTETASRTQTVRIELPNPKERLRPGMFATVQFGGVASPALLVPSEALIRTGKRTLVMVASDGGKFLPAEVTTGRESGGRTEVLSGLSPGEKVVASGQFLVESEASLSGIQARPATKAAAAPATPVVYRSTGRIEKLTTNSITLSHQPVPALQWPAMTMTFRLPDPALARGFKAGGRVDFAFEQRPEGPTMRHLSKASGQ